MSFKLNMGFTNEQLEIIHLTGNNVVVAKPTGGSGPNVAWQVIKPTQSNSLSWEENYGIYASTSRIVNGAKLDQLSSVPVGAVQGRLYTLEPSAAVTGPLSGGASNSYSLANKYDLEPFMTVGLFQDASVNGTNIAGNAVSAVPVILGGTAEMTPFTTVYIWLQSQVISNTVVTNVTTTATQLTFGGGINEIDVTFDSSNGRFINTGSRSLPKGVINHIEPSL